jgi:hypothetical protein
MKMRKCVCVCARVRDEIVCERESERELSEKEK